MSAILRVFPRPNQTRRALRRSARCSTETPPTDAAGHALNTYDQVRKQHLVDHEERLKDEKLGITRKFTDPFDSTQPRDPVRARGSVLEGVVREGKRSSRLPDDEYVMMMGDKHPAMPDFPKTSGDWMLDPHRKLGEIAAKSDSGVELPDTAMSLKAAQAVTRNETRQAHLDKIDSHIANQVADSPIDTDEARSIRAKEAVGTPSTGGDKIILPGGGSATVPKIRGPMIAEDLLPPPQDVPLPVRKATKDEEAFLEMQQTKESDQMERVYAEAFERWKAVKKLEKRGDRLSPDEHADEQVEAPTPPTAEEIAARNAKHIAAQEELDEKQKSAMDPLDALEMELYPERYQQQEDADATRDRVALEHAARVNNKMIPNALTIELKKLIQTKGPVPISEYMKECNINPRFGYYTTKKKVFGRDGDFITSPELSCMFAECLASWAYDTWSKLGEPTAFHLIEFGPGRGVLMSGVLRALESFPKMLSAARIGMVEISETLMDAQRAKIEEDHGKAMADRVEWAEDLEGLTIHDDTVPIVAFSNELFDVFAVSKFQYTERGWCEWLVDIEDNPEVPEHFKFVLSNAETAASLVALPHSIRQKARDERKLGLTIELQMQGYVFLERLLAQISRCKGAFLVVDYGVDGYVEDSLRGIKNHEFVHPLTHPGEVDLSGFVSFKLLSHVVSRSEKLDSKIHVSPPMSQGEFLRRVGIEARAAYHLSKADTTRSAARIAREFEQLTDEDSDSGMGKKFRTMCFSSKSHGLVPPCPW